MNIRNVLKAIFKINSCIQAQTHAILPYEQYLARFAAHFQQVILTTNVAIDLPSELYGL